MPGEGGACPSRRIGCSVRAPLRCWSGYRMGRSLRHALPLAVSSRDEWRQTMMEMFELGGMAATLVAASQGNLLQALLNGYATPSMYAEELGLDPTATERVLEVLTSLGFADCRQGRHAASAALKDLDAIGPGGVDGCDAMWSQVPGL